MSYYHNRRNNGDWFNKIGTFIVCVVALAALAGFIYVRTLYALGEISHDDYARMSGRPPKVILVR